MDNSILIEDAILIVRTAFKEGYNDDATLEEIEEAIIDEFYNLDV